jgi:2Fe-2S ferredoxin
MGQQELDADAPDGDMGGDPSPRVRFEPMGLDVSVPRGRRVYDVAMAHGLPLAQSCRGDGICSRCAVRVLRGAEYLSPERRPERARKAANRVDRELRLACLTTVRGPVVLTTDYW